jgi:hypothetical protein
MNEPFEWEKPDDPATGKPIAPEVNRAQAAFRVFLWVLPAGVVVLSGGALDFLISRGILPSVRAVGVFWLIFNVAFVLGAGWFSATLSQKARAEPDGVFYLTVLFVFLQVFLIPLLLGLLLFLACVIDPVKLGRH